MSISKQSMATLMAALAPVVHDHCEKMAAPLRRRIAEPEARPELKYSGVWKGDTSYPEGAAVTQDGSCWVAKAVTLPGQKPGDSDAWTLAVKRGRDGKDARS